MGIQNSGTKPLSSASRLLVSERVEGATFGTGLRTADGGRVAKANGKREGSTFATCAIVPDTYVLSIGKDLYSVLQTTDGGAAWTLQFKNDDPKAFYDSISFWDANHGIVIGDSINGQLCIMTTENGGRLWNRVPASALPPALENEGAFAASGSNIALMGKTHAWIGTGAARRARVLRTTDRGRTWKVSDTPLIAGSSAGIFSIAFRDSKHGVVVGGDYTKEKEAVANLAVTNDGGETWTLVKGLSGYRSAVAYVPVTSIPSNIHASCCWSIRRSDSTDDVAPEELEGPGFDTLSFVRARVRGWPMGWAAGANGSIGKLTFNQ